jgi:beta-xylosidase
MEAAKERDVQITVNTKPVTVPMQTSGADIKSRAHVDPNWQLFRIQGDHEIEVGNDQSVHATPNEKFIATPVLEPA